MNYRKVTAIIPSLSLEIVELELKKIGLPGMSVTNVEGYGEYRNLYTKGELSDCSRVEVFTEKEKAKQIVTTIAKAAHQGLNTDGIIAVLPVEDLIHINEFTEVTDDGK